MTPLNRILRKCTTKIDGKDQLLNVHRRHQTICKKWKTTVRKYSLGIGIKFGIEKYAMLVRKNTKLELPNQDKIRTLGERETYQYLDNLETDTSKQVEMKDKIQKEYLMRTWKLLETKLSSRKLFKRINTGLYSLLDIRDPF